jgi:hypothetical protein
MAFEIAIPEEEKSGIRKSVVFPIKSGSTTIILRQILTRAMTQSRERVAVQVWHSSDGKNEWTIMRGFDFYPGAVSKKTGGPPEIRWKNPISGFLRIEASSDSVQFGLEVDQI